MRLLAVAAWTCLMLPAAELSRQAALLAHERNPSKLESAAVTIAGSGDGEAIQRLTTQLGNRSFLSRLDQKGDTSRLERVFRAMQEHPSPASERLCISLAANAAFSSLPARMNFLLNALAAVRPVSAAGEEVFRKTGRSGFLEVNGPLLAANGSPRAVGVLEELLSDETTDPAQRVSMAHWSVVPHRTRAEIVAMCARLLEPGRLSSEVARAVAESLFDYRVREWFGVRTAPPTPPAWSSAGQAARMAVRQLGEGLLARGQLGEPLRAAIQRTLKELG